MREDKVENNYYLPTMNLKRISKETKHFRFLNKVKTYEEKF